MGIHRFFPWFKETMADSLICMGKGDTFQDLIDEGEITEIDNFFIDLNGEFHKAAQTVYKYGNGQQQRRLLAPEKTDNRDLKTDVFKAVCESIEELFHIVNPTKRLILCVDGPAPQSKQKQQRQRRFKSAMERATSRDPYNIPKFDSNSITPGTKFMDHLTKYIDWYIRKKVSTDKRWQRVEVVFSNEKVPGEGEHKIFNYIRTYNQPNECYCIHGLDADLIMLALGTKLQKMYLLREDQFDDDNEFFCIDIGHVQKRLHDMMHWGEGRHFIEEYAINDFIFLCFLIGNDFLPQMPSIEVWNRGLDMIIRVYKEVCSRQGHITRVVTGDVIFVKSSLEAFMRNIAQYEKEMLQEKIDSRVPYFANELLEQCTTTVQEGEREGKSDVDIDMYRGLYYTHKFSNENVSLKKICHEYLEGMQWVLSYYTKGVPNWKWFYPHHYAPFAYDLAEHTMTFKFPQYEATRPNYPYQQLLCVLPPMSAKLMPAPLSDLLTRKDSPIKHLYPENFPIDVAGKRKEYEGVVLLPIIDSNLIDRVYMEYVKRINDTDKGRNKRGKSFTYNYDSEMSQSFESFYGNISECYTRIGTIEM